LSVEVLNVEACAVSGGSCTHINVFMAKFR